MIRKEIMGILLTAVILLTVFIGVSFAVFFSVDEGEKLCLIVSIGVPDEEGHVHKSKPLDAVTETAGGMPKWFRNGVEAALLAPTAINQQKFRFELEENGQVRIVMGKGPFIHVDEGILQYHFEAGAGKEYVSWID